MFVRSLRPPSLVRLVPLLACVALGAIAIHCGSTGDADPGPPGGSSSGGAEPDASSRPDGIVPPPGGPAACSSAEIVEAIEKCIDEGTAPRACLAAAKARGAPPCDVDMDGLDDSLEDAMLRSYAPVIAYNKGERGRTEGDSESSFPTNSDHYVAHSTLYWRVDADDNTKKVVDAKPTLDKLRLATFDDKGTTRRASSTALGEGPNFWLCLNQDNGQYPSTAIVRTFDESRNLVGGIDVLAVAHFAGKTAGEFVFLGYMLFHPYNKFTLDDHEGDFEGGAVFVSLDTGKIAALYTDRHPTADAVTLIALEGAGALPAKDPSTEAPHYNVCDDTSTPAIGGARFWDFAGKRHHPVIYAAGGDHASFGYPGATKIKGIGCTEATMVRDVHNGEGPKLVMHQNAYYTDWGQTKAPVARGVHIRNLGEREHLREAWTDFAGQWGCSLSAIPKSYPGPWDNARLCRHWLTNDWGNALPFQRSSRTSCAQ